MTWTLTKIAAMTTLITAVACGADGVTGHRRLSAADTAGAGAQGMFGRIASALGFGGRLLHVPPYTGADEHGIPNYAHVALSAADRAMLLRVYGIEDPNRLYVSDSTADGFLDYDTEVKRCASCYVNSYHVGFVSVRRPGESWQAVERRVRAMRPSDFPASARTESASTADLDPDIRADVEQMLADAQRAGFPLRVTATYRSPEREALVMAQGLGRTHTLTSVHSYGRAIDIVIGDGKLAHAATRTQWIAFRRWVIAYHDGEFHILGDPDRTWDWPHVEVPRADLGFRSIDAALARARTCSMDPAARRPCDFPPHLPPGL